MAVKPMIDYWYPEEVKKNIGEKTILEMLKKSFAGSNIIGWLTIKVGLIMVSLQKIKS